MLLVTGGAGFIGSSLVDKLIERGERVRVLDNFSTGQRNHLNRKAELFEADIRDLQRIRPAFDQVHTVFHCAALPRVPLSIENPLDTHLINVVGTLNVLLAAREARVRRFIHSSSSSVYGDQARLPLNESMSPHPINPYGLQKYAAERYVEMFHTFYGMPTLSLRYFNVFGPRMAIEGAYVTVISLFLRARKGEVAMTIFGDGEQTRDFTHVNDVVRANMLAMDCEVADGRPINIGQGRNISINKIAAIIGGKIAHVPARIGEVRDTLADNTQAEELLGWTPQMTTEQGLEDLLRRQGIAE